MWKSLNTALIASLVGVTLITGISFAYLLYRVKYQATEDLIVSNAETITQQLATLGKQGIAGGNLMKLKGPDALERLQHTGALLVAFKGVSDGSPKTDFFAAIPPKEITYTFVNENTDAKGILARMKNLEYPHLDRTNWHYYYRLDLDLKNGGHIIAVYPANSLNGLAQTVIWDVIKVSAPILMVVLVLGGIFGRRLSRPIAVIAKQIETLSTSLDLSRRVHVDASNEIGRAAHALNAFLDRIQEIISESKTASREISDCSTDIVGTTKESHKHIERQQQASENLTRSMADISHSIHEIADNAQQSAHTSRDTARIVADGRQLVSHSADETKAMATGMAQAQQVIEDLGRECSNVESVIGVISAIAEQTNLLALNAAIEAARAGEQGRGFAVVADEVRTLAARTGEATQEVSQIITNLQNFATHAVTVMQNEAKRTEKSAELAEKAEQSLQQITQAMNSIDQMIQNIASQTDQQSRLIQEVGGEVTALDGLSDELSRHIESSVSKSSNISQLAQKLHGLVDRFKI